MPDETLQRKHRSEKILRAEGVPINDWLPRIESEAEADFRIVEEVALRAMALCLVAVKGEGLLQVSPEEVQTVVQRILSQFRVESRLSAKEREFVFGPTPGQQVTVQFTWRYEALWVLLWALGFVEELGRPDTQCDVPKAVSLIRGLGHDAFVQQSKLRAQAELLDAADLIYRYHWAIREFHQLRGQEPPANLNPGVVMERHHALNWLIGSGGDDWDTVDTST
jgi:Domain of unknown function (DUF4272)